MKTHDEATDELLARYDLALRILEHSATTAPGLSLKDALEVQGVEVFSWPACVHCGCTEFDPCESGCWWVVAIETEGGPLFVCSECDHLAEYLPRRLTLDELDTARKANHARCGGDQ